MKLKFMITAIMIATIMVFILFLCTGCGKTALQDGDTIIPPVPSNTLQGGVNGLNNLSNFSNISPLAPPSSNMAYTLLDNANAPISIFADNKYLYLLRYSGEAVPAGEANQGAAKYGNTIEVYDVENASLVRKISNKALEMCSAFTVKDSNLYAFDVKTGRILLFSSSGSLLSTYSTGLTEAFVEKLAVAGGRQIILKIRGTSNENPKLAIADTETENTVMLEPYHLILPAAGPSAEINDFCLTGENTILVAFSDGRLCQFDTAGKKPEKSCVLPVTAEFIEFDGNVLYYASDGTISLNPGNAANFSNLSNARYTGRILVNSEFPWPDTAEELGKWLLSDLQIPFANDGGRHYGMARNNKYLFFLDIVPAQQEKGITSPGFLAYRIMK